jgi:hypothetical protein
MRSKGSLYIGTQPDVTFQQMQILERILERMMLMSVLDGSKSLLIGRNSTACGRLPTQAMRLIVLVTPPLVALSASGYAIAPQPTQSNPSTPHLAIRIIKPARALTWLTTT